MNRQFGLDYALALAGAVMIGGTLIGRPLAAQQPPGGDRDHAAMGMMMDCPMMSAAMQGPGAALDRKKELALTDAQVGQLQALQARNNQAQSAAMEQTMALHKKMGDLSDSPQFDESAARIALDRMGTLHTEIGLAVLRAPYDVRALLTPVQRKAFTAGGTGMMGMHGMDDMKGDGMMGMMNMANCPMMPAMGPGMSSMGVKSRAGGAGKTQSKPSKPKAGTTPPAMDHHGRKAPVS